MLFFLSTISFCFCATITPGPNFILVTTEAIKNGSKSAVQIAYGVTVGVAISMMVCVFGLSFIMNNYCIKVAFFSAGGFYFIFLAFQKAKKIIVSICPLTFMPIRDGVNKDIVRNVKFDLNKSVTTRCYFFNIEWNLFKRCLLAALLV